MQTKIGAQPDEKAQPADQPLEQLAEPREEERAEEWAGELNRKLIFGELLYVAL